IELFLLHFFIKASNNQRCHTRTVAAGLVLLIVGSIGLVAYNPVLRWQVLQHIALRNGTLAYSQFISPKVPVRIQFYAFDLQNPIEVINGDRPFVVQRGPFTYAEVRRKEDVSCDELRDWLTYKQNRTYLFLRNESIADDSWRFTTANLPLVTILNSLRFMPQALQRFASAALAAFPNETLFPRLSVRDVAFGYHDKLLRLAHEHLGEIQAFNGSRSLHFWSSELANLVIGSDGSLAPPFLNKSALLPAFISDICRSLYGVFDSEVDAAGGLLRLWRFTGPDRLLANASENPDNAGYCTPAGNCLPAGLFNLTECKRLNGLHIPVVASLPHFLLAAPEIQPLSGAVLQLYKRLQINLQLDAGPAYAAFAPNLRSQFYPMLWINESAVVDVDTA
uniref:Scavenger receptor class B member 1 n=2 Tax=Macrostomum lignano TaxID=282301 RepID=A0A1I8JM54_9PLAT